MIKRVHKVLVLFESVTISLLVILAGLVTIMIGSVMNVDTGLQVGMAITFVGIVLWAYWAIAQAIRHIKSAL